MATDEIRWAQLAAFIDGEGSISISVPKTRFLSLRLQISSTDPRLMVWLKTNFEGGVYSVRPSSPRAKPAFIWSTSCRKAQRLIEACLPYFILKRQQAEVALAFQATFRMGRNQQQPLSEETRQQREGLRSQLRLLNKRGVDVA